MQRIVTLLIFIFITSFGSISTNGQFLHKVKPVVFDYCSIDSEDLDQSYILPYPKGSKYKVLQGYNGRWGHQGHAEFAYDFQMQIGSDVLAARSGIVVKVVEQFQDSTRKPGEENVVVIKHSDGTFGRYYHLTRDGVLVSEGDKVKQREKIALSGNSGASAGPHLHFDVTEDCFDWGCKTIRIEFSNVKENPLKESEMYEAQ
jgi:murein DD-endopeptidase MepM/ murein hydrolase activator NlpD